jgi:hypothetical protein
MPADDESFKGECTTINKCIRQANSILPPGTSYQIRLTRVYSNSNNFTRSDRWFVMSWASYPGINETMDDVLDFGRSVVIGKFRTKRRRQQPAASESLPVCTRCGAIDTFTCVECGSRSYYR